jgi:tRNA threonylcarbamoyladenosine biosynthesis protein TsaB
MLIAAIDNSLDLLNIAIADDEKVLTEQNIKGSCAPSEIIAATFSSALADAGQTIDDIEAIFVTLGPGSFTGIRVSLAFCKGISSAKKIPLIGISTLDVLAQSLSSRDGFFLCPIIDAKKGEVFLSLYHTPKGQLIKLIDSCAVKPERVCEIIQKPCVCFGTGITICRPFLNGLEDVTIENEAYRNVTSEAFIKAGIGIMKDGTKQNTKPIYGRRSEAEIKFNVTVD